MKTLRSCYLNHNGKCKYRNGTAIRVDLFHVTNDEHFPTIMNEGLVAFPLTEDHLHERIKDAWKYGDKTYPFRVHPSELTDEQYETVLQQFQEHYQQRIFATDQSHIYHAFEDAGARGLFRVNDPVLLGIKHECTSVFNAGSVDLEWERTTTQENIPARCLVRISNWKMLLTPLVRREQNDILATELRLKMKK